ncbi:MAG TPA: serine protease [Gemmatimonadaceae bacterium]|jgi:serine protease Do
MSVALAARADAVGVHASLASELETLATQLSLVTVRISSHGTRADGIGAGILWPLDGRLIVVTNAHVVPPSRGSGFLIESVTGRVANARVVARDREVDLALLALSEPPDEWPAPASIGDARSLRAGEIVVALGHPLGVGGALSVGVLHAVPNGDDVLVRADIRLAPGNSGGPLATLDGSVVGVNCMIAGGLGIAIPAHVADRFAHEVSSG